MRTATRAATFAGQVIASLFILWGFWQILAGDLFGGIWIGLIGWFLLSGAQLANSQTALEGVLKGVTVSEVMNPAPVTVPANISLQKLVDDFLLPRGWRSAFVVQGEQLAGLITLSDIRHIPRERWGQTPVGHAVLPLERLHTVTAGQSLNQVMPLMVARDVNQSHSPFTYSCDRLRNEPVIIRRIDMRTQEAITLLVFHPKQKAPHSFTNLFLERCVCEIVGHSSQSDLCMRFFGIPDVEAIAGRITGRISDPYEQPRDTVIVAFEKRKPVGYADIARFSDQATGAEISIMVRTDRQRRGVGTAMMQEVIHVMRTEDVKQLESYVHPENVKMQGAFQKWSQTEEIRDVTFQRTFREGEVVYTISLGTQNK